VVDSAPLSSATAGIEQTILRKNFIANVLDGAFFSFGMSFVSMQTVLPVLIKKIGGGNITIGLIPVFWIIGFNFPQILIASYAQRFRIKKRLMLKTAMGQRIPWLLLALLAYFIIPRVNSHIALMLFFFLFASAAIGGSINLPVWFDMIAKITPVERRGRLFASRLILGALLGIIGGVVVKHILDTVNFPVSFALLFLLAFGMMMISYSFLTILKEKRSKNRTQQLHVREYVRSLPKILMREKNYRNFLIADVFQYLALMANAFFTVYALEKFSLADSYAGTFTAIMMGSMIVGNIFFGYLADRYGHRINLMLSASMIVMSCSIALLAPGIDVYYIVFIGIAFTLSLSQISRLPIIAEFCSEELRPTYIALTNMISSPFILSGILGGWLANRYGYNIIFLISGGVALLNLIWWLTMVKEPREFV
jgi:MFS family permease